MKNILNMVKKWIHPIFILIMLVIIAAGCLIIYSRRQRYVSETWVRDYLAVYGDKLTELDIEVLEKSINDQINETIKGMNFETDLTEEQIMKLMAMINEKLQYANFVLSQGELSELSVDIVKHIVSDNLLPSSETVKAETASDEYEYKINELGAQLTVLRKSINELGHIQAETSETAAYNSDLSLTEDQVRDIAKKAGVDEFQVKKWIEELQIPLENRLSMVEDVYKNLAEELKIDEDTLKILITHAKETEDSVDYLTKKLGITADKLNEAFSEAGVSVSGDNSDLIEILSSLEAAHDGLKEQIDKNLALTTGNLSSVQSQITENKNAAESAISSSKAELSKEIETNKNATDTAIAENKAIIEANKEEIDAAITANKEDIGQAIKELKENVLYYEYDEKTNTLKIFPEEEGGE